MRNSQDAAIRNRRCGTGSIAVKMSHKLGSSDTAGPVRGLIFGLLTTGIGMGLWFYATLSVRPGWQDESLAVAATLIGLLLAVYAGHELSRKRR